MDTNLKKLKHVDIVYPNDKVSIKEKVGEPTEFDFSIGSVVTNFAYLEDIVKMMIRFLLKIDPVSADIVTSELSFKNLVNMFGALIEHKLKGCSDKNIIEEIDEIIYLIELSEQFRNKIVHSSYVYNQHRIKKTAKRSGGLKISSESISADYIFDIGDFIAEITEPVLSVPIILKLADSHSNDGNNY